MFEDLKAGDHVVHDVHGIGMFEGMARRTLDRVHSVELFVACGAFGLVVAAQHLKKLRKRPDAKRLLKIAEAWRPWRSAAALLLWHYRRNMPDWSAKGPKPKPLVETK